jgi:hypothetical protein
MSTETYKAGKSILTEQERPYSILYKLLSGKVSIFEDGEETHSVEVKKGEAPLFFGVFMTRTNEEQSQSSISIKSDTDVKVEIMYEDHYKDELPPNVYLGMNLFIENEVELTFDEAS